MRKIWARTLAIGHLTLVAMVSAAAPASVSHDAALSAVKAVQGLWAYTSLQSPGGKELGITGVILFKDGKFAQQSIFDGEPFDQQMAMAHAGPFGTGPMGVHMTAQQTITISPDKATPLSFHKDTQHDISVDRSGNELTVVFNTGTIQKFKRIGPGHGTLHTLDHGLLAFIDGHFLLVEGDDKAVVSGYGTFTHDGAAYDFKVTRWAETAGSKVTYLRDTSMKVTFDGSALTLADGRVFRVTG